LCSVNRKLLIEKNTQKQGRKIKGKEENLNKSRKQTVPSSSKSDPRGIKPQVCKRHAENKMNQNKIISQEAIGN
jgi:hypothetical protein